MPRITSYSLDQVLTTDDKVVGTDAATGTVRNYTVGNLSSFINTTNLIDIKEINLYNIYGKKIKNIELVNNEIDLSSIPNGVYFVKVEIYRGFIIKKIIKI